MTPVDTTTKIISHEIIVQNIFDYTCHIFKMNQLRLRLMQRQGSVNTKRSYVLGHTSLRTGVVTLDIYTARKRTPKKISAILSVLAHEIAHHQKPPYRQWHRGRWIIRQHYPDFYCQVNKNIYIMKKDALLGRYFI